MNFHSIWAILEKSMDILGGYGYPAMDKAATEFALEPGYFTWVAAIWLFGAQTFTTAEFMRMFPYGLARVNEECFASAVQKGYLPSNGNSGYICSNEGLHIARKLWRTAGQSLLHLDPILDEKLQRLFSYLDRLTEASLTAPAPPPHYYISHKHKNYNQFGTESPLEDFVVHFGALAAYRDDAHIAVWQSYGVKGHTWEAFDQLIHHETLTIDSLYSKLQRRGIPQEVYEQDVQDLVRRGWIKEIVGVYLVTAKGRCLREKAEVLTEHCFFAPWLCLGESELEELSLLASQLRDGLKTGKAGNNG